MEIHHSVDGLCRLACRQRLNRAASRANVSSTSCNVSASLMRSVCHTIVGRRRALMDALERRAPPRAAVDSAAPQPDTPGPDAIRWLDVLVRCPLLRPASQLSHDQWAQSVGPSAWRRTHSALGGCRCADETASARGPPLERSRRPLRRRRRSAALRYPTRICTCVFDSSRRESRRESPFMRAKWLFVASLKMRAMACLPEPSTHGLGRPEMMGLTLAERRAVTEMTAIRYVVADRRVKGRILDELCANTGWPEAGPGRRSARRCSPRW